METIIAADVTPGRAILWPIADTPGAGITRHVPAVVRSIDTPPTTTDRYFATDADAVDVEHRRIVVGAGFVFGLPDRDTLSELHHAGSWRQDRGGNWHCRTCDEPAYLCVNAFD